MRNKKLQDLLKAINEAMSALQAGVQCSNGAFCKEDVGPLIGTLKQAFEAINHIGGNMKPMCSKAAVYVSNALLRCSSSSLYNWST